MCLSTVYEEINGEKKMVCEYVSGIATDESQVMLTDIMGKETIVKGTLKSLDFIKNIIIIEGACEVA